MAGRADPRRIDELVAALLAHAGFGEAEPRALRAAHSMIATCLALLGDRAAVADLKLVDTALSEIRAALRCFAPYQNVRKVTTFGSARTTPEQPEYAIARNFAKKIADAGFMVITGAGPGIMQACQEGAGRGRSFGVNIKLPFENLANDIIRGDEKLVEFKYFFTRKLFFIKESSAIVLFPGGFGTHDECFEALTLVQTGKSHMVPIVFLDVPRGTYWKTWDRYVRDHILRKGLISEDDISLYKITDNVDEAVREITGFYRVFHSARVIRGRLVMRLNHPVGQQQLDLLSREFADILCGQSIRPHPPYEEEFDEPALIDLPRIVMSFDMKSYGRLRRLIDRLNEIA
ncbi:MAG: TIGR00730 family Rossman fold protein [Candidatus Dadabacteria bacterium]|nr:MAG: TIGR00730 family Rossman fold protein [Candidatus Dadabacteria bacterium]